MSRPLAAAPRPARRLVLVLFALAGAWAAAAALTGPSDLLLWLQSALEFGALVAIWWRAFALREDRAAWFVLGLGWFAFLIANVSFNLWIAHLEPIPVPSIADVFWLLTYPLFGLGIGLLARRERASGRATAAFWLDALIGATAMAALAIAVTVSTALAGSDGLPWQGIATLVAYPTGDLLLVVLILGACALRGWRLSPMWLLLSASMVAMAVCDTTYLLGLADGIYTSGGLNEVLWPLSAILLAGAAWEPARGAAAKEAPQTVWVIAVPVFFAGVALSVLVIDHFNRVPLLSLVLASVAFLALLARLVVAFAESVRLMRGAHGEARTDTLTGLGNRRALLEDIERQADGETVALALYDLDGFKHYNDTFGHPAGDELLRRLGGQFRSRLGRRARTYRLGGDEFCLLARVADEAEADRLAREGAAALAARGDGFAIGASHGVAILRAGADGAAELLREADQRMYARKHSSRASAQTQTLDALLAVVRERHPELGQHVDTVAELAAAVSDRLGLTASETATVRLAAELHDIGKIAIPDSILSAPRALTEDEWAFMRRHTVIGERIVQAAPALKAAAPLIRSSHERWDGGGYPDALAGDEIPFGARIVAACDAYEAMTADHPYRKGMSQDDALAELRRCAGTQFDPDVVAALCAVLEQPAGRPLLRAVA